MAELTRKSLLTLLAAAVAVPASAQQQPAPAAPQAAVLAPAADAKVMVVGSVVQLRSGGPKMTIIYLGNNIATVQWFLDNTGFKK